MADLEKLAREMEEKADERDRVNGRKSTSGDAYRDAAAMVRAAAEGDEERGD